MLNIKKKADYIKFGEEVAKITGCKVTYEVLKRENHFHYQLEKNGMVIGMFCYENGELSFCPFGSFKNGAPNSAYIKFGLAPSFKDMTDALMALSTLVLQ